MAYISNELTHWVGRAEDKEIKQYNILTKNILKEKELYFGQCKLSVLSKYFGEDGICEMISFTDIPLSECASHCEEYSKFGISFKKAYLTDLFATPVAYSKNPAFHGNLHYIFKTLKRLNEILIEKNGKPEFDLNDREKGHTINKNTLPLLTHILSYYEEYDKDKKFPYSNGNRNKDLYLDQESFFKNTKAGYFEREWRIIPNTLLEQRFPNIITNRRKDGYRYFKFEERYIKYIIMPKKFIHQFNQEKEDIFLGYNKENILKILAYEDLEDLKDI